jgi:tRNA G18 (ribose-2'-O)-methylase SpoU
MSSAVLILDNVRSAHNVGAILRTAEALGVSSVLLCGITPRPAGLPEDNRLPHVVAVTHRKIEKTALGAETVLTLRYNPSVTSAIEELRQADYTILALEQSPTATVLSTYTSRFQRWALIVGNEVNGLSTTTLEQADTILEIPLSGTKESLNVAGATAIALYHLLQI